MKIRRQRPDLLYLDRRADQKVSGFVVQPPQGSNHIADIRAHAELGHPPDVDGDLHGRDLIIESVKTTQTSWRRPRTQRETECVTFVRAENQKILVSRNQEIGVREHGALKEHVVVWVAAFLHRASKSYADRARQYRFQR